MAQIIETLGVHTHVAKQMAREIADRMEEMLSSAGSGVKWWVQYLALFSRLSAVHPG